MNRWLLVVPAAVAALFALPSTPANAHPAGSLSVNQFVGLTLRPDRVAATAVVDLAEIPTLQNKETPTCASLASAIALTVDGQRLAWTVDGSDFQYVDGAAGLRTSRLTCALGASAALDGAVEVTVANSYAADRIGWREMTAVGEGVRIVDSPLPTTSISDELRTYPADPLASAPDVRSATLKVEPGDGTAEAGAAAGRPDDGLLTRWAAALERRFQELAGGPRLTPAVGLLAMLLALVLGAGHAALPGHGKTVLAAYAAAERRRIRDALAVGATVTLTHTGGVLIVGLLLSTSSALAGDRLLGYLGIVSGAVVVAVGAGMIVGARRHRRHHHHHDHSHDHDHDHGHGHHHHHHGRLGLAGIGIAGGLVPSPSAIVVLLAAIGLGRTWFGVLLVLAYGIGMAGTLTAVGIALVALRRRLGRMPRLPRLTRRLSRAAPAGTAALVMVVGAGMAARAAAGVF
jgi:nickel/cobalt exporter